jgi:uncharacterized LabA/DUF88 family protein
MECNETANVYLDVQNVYMRYKKVNFANLLTNLKEQFNIKRATAFTAVDKTNQSQKSFLTYLSSNGWRVNTVDLNTNSNIDNMINCDCMLETVQLKPDWVILIAMDGDYEYLLDSIRRKGVRVIVIGAKENISLELRMVADRIIFLESIEGLELEKK